MLCDIHNHVLYNVDDGARDLDESLAMLRQAVEAGIDTVCATSHVHADFSERQRVAELQERATNLRSEIKKHGLSVDLHCGCELYYTAEFNDVALDPQFRYCQSSSYVLVELPPTEAPPWFAEQVFKLRMQGVNVLLAHPERNAVLLRNPRILEQYLDAGVFTQLTAGSIIGQYGKDIQEFSHSILKSGACTIVATDAHNTVKRPFSDAAEALVSVSAMLGTGIASQLFDQHPRAMLRGDKLPYHELGDEQRRHLLHGERKKKKLFFLF